MWRSFLALVVVLSAGRAQRVAEGPEPNGTPATATTLPTGQEAHGTLGANDSDWFRLVLATASDVDAATGPGTGAEVGDTWLGLFDAAGSPLRGNDDAPARGRYSRLRIASLPAGTYYLAVEPGAQASVNGGYVLDVRSAAPVAVTAGAIVPEAPEPNDARSGGVPTPLALPARVDGLLSSVGSVGDWDFHRFVLADESLVRVRVQATASHPSALRADDPVLYVFDGGTPPVRVAGPFHGTGFGSFDAACDLRLPAGTWQVAIRGQAGSAAGRYYLDVVAEDAARVVVHAGGCGGRQLDVATTLVGPGAPWRTERPVLGTTWCLRGSNLGAGGYVFHVVGLQATFVDLAPYGAPGCALEVVFLDTPLQLADAAGATTFAVPLPGSVALVGSTLQSQLAVFDFGNPLGLSFSNRVAAWLGP